MKNYNKDLTLLTFKNHRRYESVHILNHYYPLAFLCQQGKTATDLSQFYPVSYDWPCVSSETLIITLLQQFRTDTPRHIDNVCLRGGLKRIL